MLGIIHGNRRFVPIQNNIVFGVKGQHVEHGRHKRLNVADNQFHFFTFGVVHLAYAARFLILRVLFRRVIVQTNIWGIVATKGKGYLFLTRNGGFGQRQPHVPRRTHEYNLIPFRESNRRHCFARPGGGVVQNQFGMIFLAQGEQPFLVLVEFFVRIHEQGVILFNKRLPHA